MCKLAHNKKYFNTFEVITIKLLILEVIEPLKQAAAPDSQMKAQLFLVAIHHWDEARFDKFESVHFSIGAYVASSTQFHQKGEPVVVCFENRSHTKTTCVVLPQHDIQI